jgi:hypothetical protein
LALGELAKRIWEFRPRAEATKGARVVLAEVVIGATSWNFSFTANHEGPIFEELAIREAQVHGVRLESGGSNGVVPGGKELRDLMLGDS